ncbi:hypothetical protein BYT27DRAFT_6744361 [Phlegmacium glaucopus]|nr:hypothetical protein BYT27DRAFT_6744361 [Phlegmacium glaucopus]
MGLVMLGVATAHSSSSIIYGNNQKRTRRKFENVYTHENSCSPTSNSHQTYTIVIIMHLTDGMSIVTKITLITIIDRHRELYIVPRDHLSRDLLGNSSSRTHYDNKLFIVKPCPLRSC